MMNEGLTANPTKKDEGTFSSFFLSFLSYFILFLFLFFINSCKMRIFNIIKFKLGFLFLSLSHARTWLGFRRAEFEQSMKTRLEFDHTHKATMLTS
jgi:hypothetical protein